ncbi:MAG: lipocalin family protein [Bacteroidota bacterium]|nr:lipocalin family protein [Bacteroidota bacterium]
MKKTIYLFPVFLLLLISYTGLCQGITGSWKKTSLTLTTANGKKTDSYKQLIKMQPCYANMVYTFLPGGKMSQTADGCGESIKKMVVSEAAKGSWKINGNKLTISISGNPLPPLTYEISFSGNTMTWVFNYAENPKTLNIGGKARSMTITYVKTK